MASTGVKLGHGSKVRIGRGATPTWTQLSGLKDFSHPDQSPPDEDVTGHDSPGNTEENIPGLFPAADFTLTKDYVPEDAEDVLLTDLYRARGELILVEITPKGAATPRIWQGYVKKWVGSMPVKGPMQGELTIRVMAEVVA
ncbi:hypothetical protein SAMN05877809_1078 [Rhodobacter sp. JA431]|uniref:phage tail tube protein n=1 Tax=Rhodobacter sp. JA431 TaxID=570013 RepID=UPI000BCD9E66|nr:phage tail tube protein [Rhodobacter sp. JA431]SOC13746.1 hypothetical protein SAMN05877809_1078 [Rhodobacter sp. JA431]